MDDGSDFTLGVDLFIGTDDAFRSLGDVELKFAKIRELAKAEFNNACIHSKSK